MIGVMSWMVEIGRIDIATECSLLSSNLAYPREGHFECALHMMGYLKWKHTFRLSFDPTYPDIDFDTFNDVAECKTLYGDVTESIPPNTPDPRGKSVDLRMWVDSGPSKYVQEACKNCDTFLKNNFDGRYSLPKMAHNTFVGGYRPETDMTDPLDPDRASYYQTMIGVMRWMV